MKLENLPLDRAEHWLVTWQFAGDDFQALAQVAQEVSFPAGATIFEQGDPPDGMYLIRQGMVLVYTLDAEGASTARGIVTEGQSFGELGLLLDQPRSNSAAAGLDVTLLKIAPEQLANLEAEQPELIMRMYKALAQTLAEQWVRVGPWVHHSA